MKAVGKPKTKNVSRNKTKLLNHSESVPQKSEAKDLSSPTVLRVTSIKEKEINKVDFNDNLSMFEVLESEDSRYVE